MLSDNHKTLLKNAAISKAVYRNRVHTQGDNLVFDWVSPNLRVTKQRRPDNPTGDKKYLWDHGVEMPISVPQGMEERAQNVDYGLLIVEGTKQHLAAASAALKSKGTRYAVVGVAGCYGWSQNGQPVPDLQDIPMAGRDVFVAFDADMRTNRAVFDAAKSLESVLIGEHGARSVKYVKMSGKSDGFDDLLARSKDPQIVFDRLLRDAGSAGRRPPAPAKKFFDSMNSLKAVTLYNAVALKHPMAVTREESVAVYTDDGVYRNGESKEFNQTVLNLLGEDFRPVHLKTVQDIAVTTMTTQGRKIPTHQTRRLINVRNGLLDPMTLELHPHSPEFMSMTQFPVSWDPEATCPRFDTWVNRQAPGRREALLDAAAPMLDPTATPAKAMLLYGRSRTGKSTFSRLLEEIVGPEGTSAVSLHELSDNQFAAANMYGAILNVANDISSRDVSDLSLFKQITGADTIFANRKYGTIFEYRSTALMLFSANEIPVTNETSKAWLTRIAPFSFNVSFLNEEDASVETDILAHEIPGLFKALVLALRAHIERGGYLPSVADDETRFKVATNRVEAFLQEATVPVEWPKGTSRIELYAHFCTWIDGNKLKPMGRNKFYDSISSSDVTEFRHKQARLYSVKLHNPERGGSDSPDPEDKSDILAPFGPEDDKYGNFLSLSHKAIDVIEDKTFRKSQRGYGKKLTHLPHVYKWDKSDILVFDLETGSAANLFALDPGFIRLVATDRGPIGSATIADVQDHPGVTVGFNSLAFDMQALFSPGEILDRTENGAHVDLMALAPLTWPITGGLPGQAVKKSLSLDSLATKHLGLGKTGDLKALAKEFGGFDKIPVDDARYLDYARGDIEATKGLLGLMDTDSGYAQNEMKYLGRLAAGITGVGMLVDEKLLGERIAVENARAESGRVMLVETYGMPTVTGSGAPAKNPLQTKLGKEIAFRAFSDLGVNSFPQTAKGKDSLGSEFMQEILDGTPNEELKNLATAVRAIQGSRSVYQTIQDHTTGGRTHPTVFPAQSSGRLSLTQPGLTVLKTTERDVFVPAPGTAFVAVDLSQVDSRSLAAHSQDPKFIQTLSLEINPRTGKKWDFHTETAFRLWGSEDPKMRTQAKAISHGFAYGQGARSIAAQTGLELTVVLAYGNFMRQEFSRLEDWKKECQERARGGELDNGFGRRLAIGPDRIATQAVSTVGQSCSRDILRRCVLQLSRRLAERIRLSIHDEIVFELDLGTLEADTAEILEAFRFDLVLRPGDIPVPITASASRPGTSNWGECYEK